MGKSELKSELEREIRSMKWTFNLTVYLMLGSFTLAAVTVLAAEVYAYWPTIAQALG